jgi:hypothetical protein
LGCLHRVHRDGWLNSGGKSCGLPWWVVVLRAADCQRPNTSLQVQSSVVYDSFGGTALGPFTLGAPTWLNLRCGLRSPAGMGVAVEPAARSQTSARLA